MTVKDLFDYFHINSVAMPSVIEFNDITENVEDTIYLKSSAHKYDKEAYNEFVSKYIDRKVKKWGWLAYDTLYIQFEKEEDE